MARDKASEYGGIPSVNLIAGRFLLMFLYTVIIYVLTLLPNLSDH